MDKTEFVLLSCPGCFDPASSCRHRQRYDTIVSRLKHKGIWVKYVGAIDPPSGWRASYVQDSIIGIWEDALPIYGWDMLASVLIHEAGHVLCWRSEDIPQDPIDPEERLAVEAKANQYGYDWAQEEDVLPELYWPYRDFCLESYRRNGETGPQFLRRLELWRGRHCLNVKRP